MRRHFARLLGHRGNDIARDPVAHGRSDRVRRRPLLSRLRDAAAAATVEPADQIKLMPCAFAPTIAQVAVGSKVTFVNGPNFTHLVTGANQAWGSRDVEIQPGGTVSYTFDKAGIYPYACALHRGMSGAIIVGDAVAAAGGGAAGAGTTGSGAATTGTAAATRNQRRDGCSRRTSAACARGRRRPDRRGGRPWSRCDGGAATRSRRARRPPDGFRSGGRPSRSRGWPSPPRRR